MVVGLGAGLGAVGFRAAVAGLTRLLTGHPDHAATPGSTPTVIPAAGPWFLVALPVLGGLVVGPLTARYAPGARGLGIPEVVLAVAQRGGRVDPRPALARVAAAVVTLATGGSLGREGPSVQLGAVVAATYGRWRDLPADRRRLVVAAGASAATAASFNAPVAGALFALEIILLELSLLAVLVVAIAATLGDAVAVAVEGSGPLLHLPSTVLGSPSQDGVAVLLGLGAGLVSVLFSDAVYGAQDLLDRVRRVPEWARPAAGGVLVGLLLLVVPELYGVGYPVLEGVADGRYPTRFLLVLLVGKAVAAALTLAIGGSGGIVAPSLFLGGTFGAAVAAVAVPVAGGSATSYALLGMAAVLAGTIRAPLTVVALVPEIGGGWAVLVPLVIAVLAALATSRLLRRDSLYTRKLTRRGIRIAPAGGAPPRPDTPG